MIRRKLIIPIIALALVSVTACKDGNKNEPAAPMSNEMHQEDTNHDDNDGHHDGAGMDTHEMTLYTERTHSMTKLFFDNLQVHCTGFLGDIYLVLIESTAYTLRPTAY